MTRSLCLCANVSSECWVEIPIARVLRKTKQALREPEDDDSRDAKGATFLQSMSQISTPDTSVGYPTAPPTGPQSACSPAAHPQPSILHVVAEARMYRSPPETLFNQRTHHQIEAKNTNATIYQSESLPKYNSTDSIPSLQDSNMDNLLMTLAAEMGTSCSSIDTASASLDSSINGRRNSFRKMKSEGSSLPSILSETDNTLNEDEMMNESLVSIDIDSLRSFNIRSIDMESCTLSLQDKTSFSDVAAHTIESVLSV